jgi:hypothetical protein
MIKLRVAACYTMGDLREPGDLHIIIMHHKYHYIR